MLYFFLLFFISTPYILHFFGIYFHNEAKYIKTINWLKFSTIAINTYISVIILKFSNDLARYGHNFNDELESTPDPKLKQLYEEITNYVVKEKAYLNTDFNKKKLAKLMETNESYISKALNEVGNITFNQLVNENRIKYVIREIRKKSHKKFTIEHIYKKAGFSQQSTFSRVFKEFTTMTPSEYIDNVRNNPE